MALNRRRVGVENLESRRLLAILADVPFANADRLESDVAVIRVVTAESVRAGKASHEAEAVDENLLDEIAISIAAGNLAGTRAAELRFNYASEAMDIDPNSLQLGDAWRGRASLVRNVDQIAGTVSVFIYSAQPIMVGEGELLHFGGELSDQSALSQPKELLELVKFELNERQQPVKPVVSLEVSSVLAPGVHEEPRLVEAVRPIQASRIQELASGQRQEEDTVQVVNRSQFAVPNQPLVERAQPVLAERKVTQLPRQVSTVVGMRGSWGVPVEFPQHQPTDRLPPPWSELSRMEVSAGVTTVRQPWITDEIGRRRSLIEPIRRNALFGYAEQVKPDSLDSLTTQVLACFPWG
jgi:hypothetical protein